MFNFTEETDENSDNVCDGVGKALGKWLAAGGLKKEKANDKEED
jgi:hypothetical protein